MKSVVLMTVLGSTLSHAEFIETFKNSASQWQGFTLNNGGQQKTLDPAYANVAGDHGGVISVSVPKSGNRLYALQPSDASAYGDLTNRTLTVDFKTTGSITGPSTPFVRLYVGSYSGGNNYFVTNDIYSWNPNADTDWTTHIVQMISSNFIRWPISDSKSKTFDQVIANPEDIGLVFTGASNTFTRTSTLGFASSRGASISIDNFGTVGGGGGAVPEPATILFVLGTIPFIGKRKGG
jgi:hypothetical protein